jgi:NodT family efflux transporter outer membrane factor (OMF) lipoprotein
VINARTLALLSTPALLALFAGCTVGPDYNAPERQAPASFSALDQTTGAARNGPLNSSPVGAQPLSQEALATWWRTFNDPVLDSLIDRAVNQNLDLKSAAARVREARALLGVARSGYYPTVGANASGSRFRNSEKTAGGAFANADRAHSLYDASIDASYEIDVFGGVRRGVEAANADIDSLIEDRRDVMITLAAEVGRAYTDLRGFQRRVNLSEQIIRASRETVELTRSRFQAGLAGDLEVAQAQAQMSTREAQLPTFQAGLRTSAHRLGVLLGQEPGSLLAELNPSTVNQPDAVPPPVPTPPSEVPVGLPSELLQRRPDIRRAERNLAAATARIGIATADLYPRFSLTGAFGFQAGQIGDVFDANARYWNIGPSVRWNLFTGGAVRGRINAAGAVQEQSLYAYDQTILLSLEEVENSLTDFIQEQARRKALQNAVSANERAVGLSMDRYRSGIGDFLTVLDTQRQLYDTQDALVQSEIGVTRSLVSLYKALGGGWSEEELAQATPTTPTTPTPPTSDANGNPGTGDAS